MGAKKGLLPWVVGVLALGVLGTFTYPVVISTDYAFYCENTGSRKGFRVWWNGEQARHWYKASPLEEFMKKEYPGVFSPRWKRYAGTGKNVFGQSQMFTNYGTVGGTLFLKDGTARAWIAHHSKKEVRALYDSLLTRDRAAADAIVKKINDEVATYTD